MYDLDETREMLSAALWKLDRVDPVRKRRQRNQSIPDLAEADPQDLQALFIGDYGFEEGHFDSVIHHYRETIISSIPPTSSFPRLAELLNRSYPLLPGSPSTQEGSDVLPPSTITHLLHLAPHGEIMGHVDNLDASGKVIMGICLGAERILKLERGGQGWEVLLRNGDVYIQRDRIRYDYEHSILPYGPRTIWWGRKLDIGHRVSIMVRDANEKRVGGTSQ